MNWLIDALREPAAQLLVVVANAATLALAARIRGSQRRVNDQLRESGVLPPKQ